MKLAVFLVWREDVASATFLEKQQYTARPNLQSAAQHPAFGCITVWDYRADARDGVYPAETS